MEFIYHEQQQGSLCGVHCLNTLIQEDFYSAEQLADIARGLDEKEKEQMAVNGTHTLEYQNFIKEGSNNMDDTGHFSIQVISEALKVMELSMHPFVFSGSELSAAQKQSTAFICNMKEHWFTIRKLGQQWFNLNSLLAYPELLSDTYLELFLAQLKIKGFTIYSIGGNLPPCTADDELKNRTVTQERKPLLLSELAEARSPTLQDNSSSSNDDEDLRRALAASLGPVSGADLVSEENDIAKAMALSLETAGGSSQASELSELDKALQLSLDEHLTTVSSPPEYPEREQGSSPEDDAKSLREKRLKFYEKEDK